MLNANSRAEESGYRFTKMLNNLPDLRLMTRAARLYYEERLIQSEIASRLGLTQVAVSRLLKKAEEHGIVRTTVVTPPGAFAELEEMLEHRFGLSQVIIGEATIDSEEAVLAAIGSAAAQFLESIVRSKEVIGISSWSTSLLSTVAQMHPVRKVENCLVVQILGGIGSPSAEQHANHLAVRLSRLVHGDARFLPVPGIVALVGTGALEPSTLVASSGNIFSEEELKSVQKQGAVGDICLRFYDARGQAVRGALDDRVIGMTLDGLRQVQRSVAVCGGKRKFPAILGAVRGKWINTLVTDQYTAERLAKAQPGKAVAA